MTHARRTSTSHHVTREEFEQFASTVSGSLSRIEDRLEHVAKEQRIPPSLWVAIASIMLALFGGGWGIILFSADARAAPIEARQQLIMPGLEDLRRRINVIESNRFTSAEGSELREIVSKIRERTAAIEAKQE